MAARMGIDIGGTKANIGLLRSTGEIIRSTRLPMSSDIPCKESVTRIVQAATTLLAAEGLTFAALQGIGVGVPGTVAADGQTVLNAPNLSWVNEPVGAYFKALTGRRIILLQDSRAAAWGEYTCGAGRGAKVLVCIPLGTGVGCGIVMHNQIYSGALGTAGELGHVTVVRGGQPCGCGRRGCCEAYASGTGIAKSADAHPAFAGQHLRSEDIFRLAGEGNADARGILAEAVEMLGQTVCAIVNILSPDVLVFSGGMITQRELFVDPLIAYIRGHAYALAVTDALRITCAALGSDAPMVGAGMQVF